MPSPFETYVQTELPKRPVMLRAADLGGYVGDPNDGGAPNTLKNSPAGAFYLQGVNGDLLWRKQTSVAGSWLVMTGSTPLVSTTDKTLYVAAATGDDNNDGLTSGTAFKTFSRAMLELQPFLGHNFTVHIARGVYDELMYLGAFFFKNNDYSFITITGDDWDPVTPVTGPSTGTISNVDLKNYAVTSATGWTVDNLKGKWLRLTSGANAGNAFPISANTATTVEAPSIGWGSWGGGPGVGDAFEIVTPAVIFSNTTYMGGGFCNLMTEGVGTPAGQNIIVQNIKFDGGAVSYANVYTAGASVLDLMQCEITLGAWCQYGIESDSISMGGVTQRCLIDTRATSFSFGSWGTMSTFLGCYIRGTSNPWSGVNLARPAAAGYASVGMTVIEGFNVGVQQQYLAVCPVSTGNLIIRNCAQGVQLGFGSHSLFAVDVSGCTDPAVALLDASGAALEIRDSNIHDNAGVGVIFQGSGNSHVVIVNSSVVNCVGGGVNESAASVGYSNTPSFNNLAIYENCTMSGNTAGDITLDGSTWTSFADLKATTGKTLVDLLRLTRAQSIP